MPVAGLKKNSDFKKMIPADVGCVCSYCPVASAVGTRVLLDGGNAVDAAVATGLALAVTYPQAGNLGGGGFMLIKAPGLAPQFLDYRETAPMNVTPSLFLNNGKPSEATVTGPLSVAVPGTVAGLAEALRRFGSWAWDRVIASVIDLADHGIWITNRQARYISIYNQQLRQYDSTAQAFFQISRLRPGDLFRQPDLAKTLRQLADKGPQEFYSGKIGQKIAQELQKHGGVMTEEDMATYSLAWRAPLERKFGNKRIVSVGLPSGGGLVVLNSLGLAEAAGLADTERRSVERYELLARAFRVAFKNRSTHAGDPDIVTPDVLEEGRLLAEGPYTATSLAEFEHEFGLCESAPPTVGDMPPRNTTHFCAMDSSGLTVSNTYSLNTLFGSKFVCDGTGVLMNNTIDDFGIAPGVLNWYMLFEGANNFLTPKARPVGSMAPTLVLDENDRCEIAIGASGGPRIPSLVAQVLVGMIVDHLPLSEAMEAGRVHHQYLPREIHLEESVGWDMGAALESRGYPVAMFPRLGIGAGIHYSVEEKAFQATLDNRF